MIDPVPGTTSSASQLATKSLAENFDTFLTLLTTQLKNQDPLQPLDSKEFTQQLVQFTSVEQSIATNRNLEQMIALTQAGQSASIASFIGRGITADGDVTTLGETPAIWQYELPKDAEAVVLSVYDADGTKVYETAGELAAGEHLFTWDGVGTNGSEQPDGQYQLKVSALDSLGNPITASTRISGVVNGVEAVDGNYTLVVGELKIPLSKVIAITAASE